MPTLLSDAKRLTEVSRVLVKSGLGYVALHAGLKEHLPFWQRFIAPAEPDAVHLPANTRTALEELGGAYVKLGQLLSIRPDLVPYEFCEEFKKLQDKVPPFSPDEAKKAVETSLGKPIGKIFSQFNDEPIGSASIAQCHEAVLVDGQRVVVKVQRPGVDEIFKQDIDIMKRIAGQLEKRRLLDSYSPAMIVGEFERYTRNELDFNHEARAMQRFERMFRGSHSIMVPHVHEAAEKVLVMSDLHGTKLSEISHTNIDRHKIVSILVDSMLEQIFTHCYFHADMHPGNLLLMPGNRVGLLDYGITGTLTPELRKRGVEMYAAIINNDSNAAVAALQHASTSQDIKVEALRRDIAELFMEWQDEHRRLPTGMFHLMFTASYKRGVRLPPDLILVGKALVTLEATCKTLDTDFDLPGHAIRYFARMKQKELRDAFSVRRLSETVTGARRSLAEFSENTLAVMERLKRGEVKIDIDDTDIRHLGQDLNTSSNRLSFALVISALLVFSALTINLTPQLGSISWYSVLGLLAAAVAFMVLLISIWREGRAGVDEH